MPKLKKAPPFPFVLEALEPEAIATKPMFGCLALYLEDRIVLILRDKETEIEDNGVWLATIPEHHASLKKEFPSMRSIRMFGLGETGWQNIPAEDSRFEEEVLKACQLVKKRDPRIGKVPTRKKLKKPATKKRR